MRRTEFCRPIKKGLRCSGCCVGCPSRSGSSARKEQLVTRSARRCWRPQHLLPCSLLLLHLLHREVCLCRQQLGAMARLRHRSRSCRQLLLLAARVDSPSLPPHTAAAARAQAQQAQRRRGWSCSRHVAALLWQALVSLLRASKQRQLPQRMHRQAGRDRVPLPHQCPHLHTSEVLLQGAACSALLQDCPSPMQRLCDPSLLLRRLQRPRRCRCWLAIGRACSAALAAQRTRLRVGRL